jgi:bacterial/archaeal transporter family-2 protein
MDHGAALIATVATGALVAFQPPANALLGRVVGDLGAAVISVAISMVILTVLLLTVGDVGQLGALDHAKPEYILGGIGGAAIVLVSLIAGAFIAALVAAQLTVSALLDHLGALGLDKRPLGWQALLGVALLLGGTLLMATR